MIVEETTRRSRRRELGLCGALVLATLALYAQVAGHSFLTFDDTRYVTENRNVLAGITLRGVRWAFTSFHASNWHPLTWVSHMLDVSIFGANAGAHHLVNAALHAINTALVYLVVRRYTGARGRSLCVALLFAVHPLHVESVAWVAERKDLLSTVFGLCALWAWAGYVERPSVRRYAGAGLLFALSLLAKPMWVTLPALLLVLDLWPLRRGPRLVEKLPLFALSTASCVATMLAQRGAMSDLSLPPGLRLANAAVAYVRYLAKTIWPWPLSFHYPYPRDGLPAWQVAGAVLLLLAISAVAVRARRSSPWVLVGWLWFLGTLVPVIGLVQVGTQAIADRYAYLPHLGVFIAVVWTAAGRGESARVRRVAVPAFAAVVAVFSAVTTIQLRYWSDTETLVRRSLTIEPADSTLHAALADALRRSGRLDEALVEQRETARLEPWNAAVWNNLAALEAEMRRLDDAVRDVQRAIEVDAAYAKGWDNLGHFLLQQGRAADAAPALERAVQLAPDDALAREHLAAAHLKLGRIPEALEQLLTAVRLDPENASCWTTLGAVNHSLGRVAEAEEAFRAAVRAKPSDPLTWRNLGVALSRGGRFTEAADAFTQALRLRPADPDLLHRLGLARVAQGNAGEALAIARQLDRVDPARAADLRTRTGP